MKNNLAVLYPDACIMDHALAYIHYTLCANWHYAQLPDNYAVSTQKNVERYYARARYFDTLALHHREMLNDAQWKICQEWYLAAYWDCKTPFTFSLPLVFQSETAHTEAYPSETYELFCKDKYHPTYGWL